jgi:hypothetical protein
MLVVKQESDEPQRVQITLFKEIFATTTAAEMIKKVSCSIKESMDENAAEKVGIEERIISTV